MKQHQTHPLLPVLALLVFASILQGAGMSFLEIGRKWEIGTDLESRLFEDGSLRLSGKSTGQGNGLVMIANSSGQPFLMRRGEKLSVTFTGNSANPKGTIVQLQLHIDENGKDTLRYGPIHAACSSQPVTFEYDAASAMAPEGQDEIRINTIKFQLNGGGQPEGTYAEATINEVILIGTDGEEMAPPPPPLPIPKPLVKDDAGARRSHIGFASADSSCEVLRTGAFRLIARSTGAPARTTHTSGSIPAVGRDHLVFKLKGSRTNGDDARLTVSLTIPGRGVHTAPAIPVDSDTEREIDLGMTNDFGTQDLPFEIAELSFTLTAGASGFATVETGAIRVQRPGESSADQAFILYPAETASESIPAPQKSIALFMDFENDDFNSFFASRWNYSGLEEENMNPGFRGRLLEHTAGLFRQVDTPEQADVILYSRTRPSKYASAIAKELRKGKGLVVFDLMRDPVLAKLLPVSVKERSYDQLPPRARLDVTEAGSGLYGIGPDPDADFGDFFEVTASEDAVVLSTLGDHPCAVQSTDGRIIWSAIGIGTAQRRTQHFFDLFALCAAAQTAGQPDIADALETEDERQSLLDELVDRRETAWVLGAEETVSTAEALRKRLLQVPAGETLPAELAAIRQELADAGDQELRGGQGGALWHAGDHLRNFGRFGWLLEEGLLSLNLTKSLSLQNSGVEISLPFTLGSGQPELKLLTWDIAPGKEPPPGAAATAGAAWKSSWDGEGTMEYTTAVAIPEAWRGKEVTFHVAGGIDDTDVVLFNGVQIGATDADTPNYWSAPRNYTIPQELIRFGEPNQLTCLVTNLRGNAGFNTMPVLTIPAEQTDAQSIPVRIDHINALTKRYAFETAGGREAMTVTLAIPYALYETRRECFEWPVANGTEFAAFATSEGVVIRPVQKDMPFYDKAQDGALAEGWMLFWSTRSNTPLALFLARNPDQAVMAAGADGIERLTVVREAGMESAVLGFPFAAVHPDVSAWKNGLPGKLLERLRFQQKLALNFPMAYRECYRHTADRRRVELRTRFETRFIPNDFGVPVFEWTMLQPVAGAAIEEKMLVDAPEAVHSGIKTHTGPLYGKFAPGAIAWSLDAPPDISYQMVSIAGYDALREQVGRIAIEGAKWSCGGMVPVTHWSPQAPGGFGCSHYNFDICGWCFDFNNFQAGLPMYNKASREVILHRMGWRMSAPIERYGFKLAYRYRKEPFSAIQYAIYLPPFYSESPNYAPGFGSKALFGDENEPSAIIADDIRYAGNNLGQYGASIVFRRHLLDLASFPLVSTDWGIGASGCREYWGSGHLDMLNCEYPMARSYEMLAKRWHEDALSDLFRYRAAKRMLPTLVRFYFHDYLKREGLPGGQKAIRFMTGWDENAGANLQSATTNYLSAIDVFDYAGNLSEEMVLLYKLYANEKVREGLQKALPIIGDSPEIAGYFQMFSIFGVMPFQQRLEKLKTIAAGTFPKGWTLDHGGMEIPWDMAGVLLGMHPGLFINKASDILLEEAVYDPKAHTGSFRFTPGGRCTGLTIYSAYVPESLVIDGVETPLPESAGQGLVTIPGTAGKPCQVFIRQSDRPSAWRHPLLKNLQP